MSWDKAERRLRKEYGDDVVDHFDVRGEYDPGISYKENIGQLKEKIYAYSGGATKTRQEQKHEQKQQYLSFVEEQTGQQFDTGLEGEGSLRVLPHLIKRKYYDVRIDAPILVDAEAIKNACAKALQNIAEAITTDVTQARRANFADAPGRNTIAAYGGASAYYSSGMVPYWRGGLIGSFRLVGARDRFNYELAFTAPYASIIQEGKMGTAPPPEWAAEKITGQYHGKLGGVVTAHPFAGTVTYKIQQNLANYGYLDVFADTFTKQMR